jgi:hypothetical protein
MQREEISIQSTIVSVPSSELAPSIPFPQASVCPLPPPPLDPGGVGTLDVGKRGLGGPIQTTGQWTMALCILCARRSSLCFMYLYSN